MSSADCRKVSTPVWVLNRLVLFFCQLKDPMNMEMDDSSAAETHKEEVMDKMLSMTYYGIWFGQCTILGKMLWFPWKAPTPKCKRKLFFSKATFTPPWATQVATLNEKSMQTWINARLGLLRSSLAFTSSYTSSSDSFFGFTYKTHVDWTSVKS